MKKTFTLLVVMVVFAFFTVNAQINFTSLGPDEGNGSNNARNTHRAGVSITVLHQGYPDKDKGESATYPSDYKWPYWDFTWNWDDLKDINITTGSQATPLLSSAENPAKPGYVLPTASSHAPTNRGWRWVGIGEEGSIADKGVLNGQGFFRVNNYNGGGDPVFVENVASLRNYLGSPLKHDSGDSPLNALDSVAVCVFKLSDTNNAMGLYPGMYKKTDLRLGLNFANSYLTSDVSFTLMTVDAGTSGNTVKYKMVVTVIPSDMAGQDYRNVSNGATNYGVDKTDSAAVYGSSGPIRYEIADIFISTNDAKTINLAEEIAKVTPGFTFNNFIKKKLLIALIGESQGAGETGGAEHKYDPVMAIDNLHVKFWRDWYQANNSGLDLNEGNPPTGIRDVVVSTTKVIGHKGQIEISGAKAAVTVYNITGQKVGTLLNKGSQFLSVPAGIYLVTEPNLPTVKVVVK